MKWRNDDYTAQTTEVTSLCSSAAAPELNKNLTEGLSGAFYSCGICTGSMTNHKVYETGRVAWFLFLGFGAF